MQTSIVVGRRTPLQVSCPGVFQALVLALHNDGLQSYDVEADVVVDQSSDTCTLQIRYGSHFEHCEELSVRKELLNGDNSVILDFFQRTVRACHETLKQEYREYMKQR